MQCVLHLFCQILSVTLLRFSSDCGRDAAHTATIAVTHHFTDSCHHHPPTAAATITFVDHRPASPPLLPVGHLRCRPLPPSLLPTAVVSLQPLPIRKMDITADTGLGVSDIYESRNPEKRVAGARRKGFDPLWFNEGGAWKLVHVGESKFEKPIHFSILVP